jgi:nicotinamide-nucleotide amidase
MTVRAGILITGTEVLTGIINDRNGPWLSERMRENGIEAAEIRIVGDRPSDLHQALESMKSMGYDLIVTSGGLGPTADDLTAEVVGRFQAREMVLDDELEATIAEILKPLEKRWPNLDREAMLAANRKQAVIPDGCTILQPVGTAPGLVVPPSTGTGPTVLVLPGPPRELHPMWHSSLETEPMRVLLDQTPDYERRMLRLFGMPESELAQSLREIEEEGLDLTGLEVTTCLRRGEIEIATTFERRLLSNYELFEGAILQRHGALLFSSDGSTIDQVVAGLLAGKSISTAESCTAGLLAARLADSSGASDYLLGGVIAYSNEAKVADLDVSPELIESHGAVSGEVALAMARGARARFNSKIAIAITGIAGPGGGSADKPVGLVWFALSGDGLEHVRSVQLPGGRADVRERATTVSMHLIRRALLGDLD